MPPLFVDVRHNRGVVAHRGHMVTRDNFLKGLKGQEHGLISRRLMCNNFSWADHTRTRFDRGGEHPNPTKTRPNTGVDPEQVSRIEPPLTGDPSPSTKTDPVSPPPAKPPEAREGLTRGTTGTSDALQGAHPKSTVRNQPAPAKPGDPRSPAKLSWGRLHGTKSLRYRKELLDSRKRREDPAGTGIDSHTEILRRLRGHEIRLLLVYHNPEVRQSERSSLIDSLAFFSEEERTNQSSR